MRAALSLIAGSVGQCMVTASAVVTLVFLALGYGGTLAVSVVALAIWLAGFWGVVCLIAAAAHVAGLLRLPGGETSRGH